MIAFAEYGMAAHCRYKEAGSNSVEQLVLHSSYMHRSNFVVVLRFQHFGCIRCVRKFGIRGGGTGELPPPNVTKQKRLRKTELYC